MILTLVITQKALSQQATQNTIATELIKKSAQEKTLASWDLLGLLYQVSINDVTANDKSINFKSTLYGIHKIFDSSVATSDRYRQLSFQRYFELSMAYKYKNQFSPSNLSFGFNYAIIHKNDVSTAKKLNSTSDIFAYVGQLEDGPLTVLDSILLSEAARYSEDPSVQKILFTPHADLMAKFITTGDTSVLNDDPLLKHLVDSIQATNVLGFTTSLSLAISQLQKKIDNIYAKVQNDWNVTASPTITYGFNNGKWQGYELAVNALKGFKLFSDIKRTSQFIIKVSYKIGDDTLIEKVATNRKQITDELGINQVLSTKSLKADDGLKKKPSIELAITAGYNWVMSGLNPNEKAGQPALIAKLGFLLGKESWLVFPFNYNFSTHKGLASISIKVNLGDPPFK